MKPFHVVAFLPLLVGAGVSCDAVSRLLDPRTTGRPCLIIPCDCQSDEACDPWEICVNGACTAGERDAGAVVRDAGRGRDRRSSRDLAGHDVTSVDRSEADLRGEDRQSARDVTARDLVGHDLYTITLRWEGATSDLDLHLLNDPVWGAKASLFSGASLRERKKDLPPGAGPAPGNQSGLKLL